MKFLQKLHSQYSSTAISYSLYWRIYGGWKSLFSSPYLLVSVLLTFAGYPLWHCGWQQVTWYSLSTSALPNLLGFTLAGYTIIIGFGDDKFRNALRGDNKAGDPSPFMVLNGAFVHFIVIQIVALLSGIIGSCWEVKTGIIAWLGLCLFIYAVLTGLAAVMAVLNVANWFNKCPSDNPDGNHPPSD